MARRRITTSHKGAKLPVADAPLIFEINMSGLRESVKMHGKILFIIILILIWIISCFLWEVFTRKHKNYKELYRKVEILWDKQNEK